MSSDKMDQPGRVEVPKHLALTAVLSASLTISISIIYGLLSIFAIIEYHQCDPETAAITHGPNYFLNILYRQYIIDEACSSSLNPPFNLMLASTVLVLSSLTLAMCALCLIAAVSLLTAVYSETYMRNMNTVAYFYVCCCTASLVVDVTFGTHFGIDYGTLNSEMQKDSITDYYTIDMVRLSAFALMVLTFKGFIYHVVNVVLLILLVTYAAQFQKQLQLSEHSIHKVGALSAYSQKRNDVDNWQVQNDMFLGVSRGPHVNPSYISDEDTRPRTPNNRRDLDYRDRSLDRADSWKQSGMTGSRPFSYLDSKPKAIPVKPPTSPAIEPQWRREDPQQWRQDEPPWRKEWSPPVPVPDYSPTTPRRLKSALKPSYM